VEQADQGDAAVVVRMIRGVMMIVVMAVVRMSIVQVEMAVAPVFPGCMEM
jgi:hypothetical protein